MNPDELKNFLAIQMFKFTRKHRGLVSMSDLQTLAKFLEQVNEEYEKNSPEEATILTGNFNSPDNFIPSA